MKTQTIWSMMLSSVTGKIKIFSRHRTPFVIPLVLLTSCRFLWIRASLHLVTVTQIFDVVSTSSEMGCIVTNVTVRT